jgi:hypothetical protein
MGLPSVSRLVPIAAALLLSAPFGVRGADAAAADTDPQTDIRKVMLSEYRYTPPGTKTAPAPTALTSASPAPAAPSSGSADAVRMDPIEVRATGVPIAALLPLEQPAPEKAKATVASRLGIGVHYLKIGKVRLFMNTVFYVPFLVGFQW